MNCSLFLKEVQKQFNSKLPFVIYALPQEDVITALFQEDNVLYETNDFLEEAFVFSSFNFHDTSFCIPASKSKQITINRIPEECKTVPVSINENIEDKEEYLQMVAHAVQTIEHENMEKIVLSRCKKVSASTFNFDTIFYRLFHLYPTAFRYVWYHPKTGLWCGASPELLVKTEKKSFETMALAGTKKNEKGFKPNWTFKEIHEQKLVVNQIMNKFQKFTSVVKVSKAYNQEAGSLVHLRSDITGILKKGKSVLPALCKSLHPTPAVCGTPQKEAKVYINDYENYDREFYTGFLGPICSLNNCSSLFVNLRCMKIVENTASIFVGGGITENSIPEEEWKETVNKLQTMLQVLQPLL